eukprot:TRINITY_DN4224_c0_g1_i1.p1 TRINITY_DN4224_c0_g1~~TRINITY_DN4224_c0_g1_i1.p1  ORF type:complete len:234 (+),score=35.24 TRINITY_DN4224_c0_g1_i1:40-702(+)
MSSDEDQMRKMRALMSLMARMSGGGEEHDDDEEKAGIVNAVKSGLNEMGITHYELKRETNHTQIHYSIEGSDNSNVANETHMRWFVRHTSSGAKTGTVLSTCSLRVPDSYRWKVCQFIMKVNHHLNTMPSDLKEMAGHYEMDFNDGEVLYKTYLPIEKVSNSKIQEVTKQIFRTHRVLYVPFANAVNSIIQDDTSIENAKAAWLKQLKCISLNPQDCATQ